MPPPLTVPTPLPLPLVIVSAAGAVKLAVTERACDIVTLHVVALPAHTPPQSENTCPPGLGVAISVTTVPSLYELRHVPVDDAPMILQLRPLAEIVPLPVPPPLRTDSAYVTGKTNDAVTVRAWDSVTTHVVDVPVHAPPQPANVLTPPVAAAVSVTTVPDAKVPKQAPLCDAAETLQLSPLPVTLPVPFEPPDMIVREYELAGAENDAVTERACDIVMTHAADVPAHAPPHPTKACPPTAAVAVNVTEVFCVTFDVHVPDVLAAVIVQLMLPSAIVAVTVPLPVPPPEPTVSRNSTGGGPKLAVTERAWLSVTRHVVAVPEHEPPQPRNVYPPAAGAAVSVTTVFCATLDEHVPVALAPVIVQLMLPSAIDAVTVPLPTPPPDATVSGKRTTGALKRAVTARTRFIATLQVCAVPLHAPPHPLNVKPPVAGAAVRTTVDVSANDAEQVPDCVVVVMLQLMPAPVTVPLPSPAPDATVNEVGVRKLAVALRPCDIVVVHVADVPVQASPQPANTWPPVAAVAVSVTDVLGTYDDEQVPDCAAAVIVQLTPPLPVTVPLPVPPPDTTVSGNVKSAKFAVTVAPLAILKRQVDVPLQEPPHPAKTLPDAGFAARMTSLFCAKDRMQVPLESTPAI